MPEVIITADGARLSAGAREDDGSLLVPLSELESATGWALKPEGLCRDEACVPIPAGERGRWLREDSLDFAAFAAYLGEVPAHDGERHAWSFAAGPASGRVLRTSEAPNFTLPDLEGRPHSLSDYRGRKVFLVSWASW